MTIIGPMLLQNTTYPAVSVVPIPSTPLVETLGPLRDAPRQPHNTRDPTMGATDLSLPVKLGQESLGGPDLAFRRAC